MGLKNGGYVYTDRVPKSAEGLSIATFYSRHYPHSDTETWLRRIAGGQIRLNGRRTAPDDVLRRGDALAYHRPPWEEDDVPANFYALFEDENVLVLAKPSGLPVLPGGGFLENTLLHLARRLYGPSCSPLHRLGRGTSGAILFTRDIRTARFLTAAMEERRIRKVYLALASGTAMPDAFTIDAPIGPVPYPHPDPATAAEASAAGGAPGFARGSGSAVLDRVYDTRSSIHAYSPSGRPSISHVRVLRRIPRENESLLEVMIPTGRPHQIRIHLAYAGFPLVGDPLYQTGGIPRARGDEDGTAARPGDCGYFLHSWKIAFPHPESGQDVEVICPPPPVFEALLSPML